MASFPALRARIASARMVLGDAAVSARDSAGAVSRTQANAVVDLVRRSASLETEDAAKLTLMATSVLWAADDVKRVMAAIDGQTKGAAHKSRSDMQDWRDIVHLLPGRLQDQLADPELDMLTKRDIIFSFLISLGLRCPTEKTMKLVSSLLWIADKPESTRSLTVKKKYARYLEVKEQFKRLADTSPGASPLLSESAKRREPLQGPRSSR